MAKALFGSLSSSAEVEFEGDDNVRLKKIPADDLRVGMDVVDIDRPWLDTPFLMQGFTIKTPEEITILRELCVHVFIDADAYTGHDEERGRGLKVFTQKPIREELSNFGLREYKDQQEIMDEIKTVEHIYRDYEDTIGNLFEELRIGRDINVAQVKKAVTGIVASIKRNPDACMLLCQLRRKDDYAYNHAMGCSVFAASLGRHLGLPTKELENLTLGALMLDIGKIEISSRILKKRGHLTDAEFTIVKGHVAASLRLIDQGEHLEQSVLAMINFHHERVDGKGYPKGLSEQAIPVYARIAAIVDCYDALINERPYAKALPPSEAIRKLYNMRKINFQPELVEEFIQAIGVYPPGTLIELTNDEVAVVVTEGRKRRLRPKVLMILDENKQPYQETLYLNLMNVKKDKEGRPLEILRSLDPGAYNIDLEALLFPT